MNLSEISSMGRKLRELRDAVNKAEEAYKFARSEAENYERQLVDAMYAADCMQHTLSDGTSITIKTKYRCNPNKDKGRDIIIQWLKDHGGELYYTSSGKPLISDAATVLDINALKKANIPFEEVSEVNTVSMKGFITHMLEAGEIQLDEIPNEIHFCQVDEIEIKQ